MNRFLSVVVITLVTVAGFAMYTQQDVGYLNVGFADYKLETNLLIFGAATLAALFCFLLLVRVLGLFKKIAVFFGAKRKTRLAEKARDALSNGLIELAEGRFDKAEKLLLQQVKHSDNALLAYLAAARAAQQQGAHDRRDNYLRKAHTSTPTAEIAIGLTKAELQLAHSQYEQALATLTLLYELAPKHAYVLKLLGKTYQLLSDWEKLKGILVDIKKLGVLSNEKMLSLEVETWKGLLSNRTYLKNYEHLTSLWNETPHHLKALPDMVEHYARMLIKIGASGKAEEVLRQYLNSAWHESTIILYSELDVLVDNKQLDVAEAWLKEHQHNAYLLLGLGKMCVGRSLWGKARSYFEASIAIKPMPESYLQLAMLLEEHMSEPELAQENYRQGLHLLVGDYGKEALEKTGKDFHRESPQPHLKVV
jgi:HemY protein